MDASATRSNKESVSKEIQLFNTTDDSLPVEQSDLNGCVASIEQYESVEFNLVEAVFVDEVEIRRINREYLNHDYVTDIITFPYHGVEEVSPLLEGTLYCCRERILEQAKEHNVEHKHEFCRILIHGLLHLAGYSDATDAEKETMTNKENFYLTKIGFTTN